MNAHRISRLASSLASALAGTLAGGLLLAATANAASLSLVPSATVVTTGSTFTVDLVLDASDVPGPHPGLYGGEVIVDFNNSLLGYGNFALAPGLSFFLDPVTASSGTSQTVHFGFDNATDTSTVGTFTFTALGSAGSIAQIGLADGDDFSGSFAAYVPSYKRFYPAFNGTSVSLAPVPVPAAMWLFGSAFGLLAFCRRGSTNAA